MVVSEGALRNAYARVRHVFECSNHAGSIDMRFNVGVCLSLFNVRYLLIGRFKDSLDLLNLCHGHVLRDLLHASSQVLSRALAQVLSDLPRVDRVKDLGIAEAVNRVLALQLDLRLAVMLDTVFFVSWLHLDQDKRDVTALVFKTDIHTLRHKSLCNRLLNLLIALD